MRIPAILSTALLLGCTSAPPSADSSVSWLLSQQSPDGAWRSQKYQALSSGTALTPFLLYALDDDPRMDPDRRSKALDFVKRRIGQTEEYPTYTAALSLLTLARYRSAGWEKDVARLVEFLRGRQLSPSLGWSEKDPEFGGWDHGAVPPRHPQAQRPDISLTAFAVEALRASGVASDDETIQAAVRFVKQCRARDGGYFFTPRTEVAYQNKAGRDEEGFRSYGTATCDAIRILRAGGTPPENPILSEAEDWLDLHAGLNTTPGFPDEFQDRAGALRFYYYHALSRVRPSEVLREQVRSLQDSNGSFGNVSGYMKEDDPLIATGLAWTVLR